jgi:hypothetical protein
MNRFAATDQPQKRNPVTSNLTCQYQTEETKSNFPGRTKLNRKTNFSNKFEHTLKTPPKSITNKLNKFNVL